MNVQRDPDTTVAAWLDEGPYALPESTKRAIFAALPTTTQRRPTVALPWRFFPMNRVRLVALTTVLALSAVGGLYLNYLRDPRSIGPAAAPSATAATPTPTPGITSLGTATLSDDGCEFEPGPTPASSPGRVTIDLVNASSTLGGFDLAQIQPGFSFEDFAAHVESENEQLGRIGIGYNLKNPESANSPQGQQVMSAGKSGAFYPISEPGTYGIVCYQLVSNNRTDHLHLLGPIEIGQP